MIYDPNLHTNYRFGLIFSGWLFRVQGVQAGLEVVALTFLAYDVFIHVGQLLVRLGIYCTSFVVGGMWSFT